MTSAKPELPDYLGNIRIILTRTSHPANIGSAVRAMKTMGLHKLTIVAPNLMSTPMTGQPPVFNPENPQRILMKNLRVFIMKKMEKKYILKII